MKITFNELESIDSFSTVDMYNNFYIKDNRFKAYSTYFWTQGPYNEDFGEIIEKKFKDGKVESIEFKLAEGRFIKRFTYTMNEDNTLIIRKEYTVNEVLTDEPDEYYGKVLANVIINYDEDGNVNNIIRDVIGHAVYVINFYYKKRTKKSAYRELKEIICNTNINTQLINSFKYKDDSAFKVTSELFKDNVSVIKVESIYNDDSIFINNRVSRTVYTDNNVIKYKQLNDCVEVSYNEDGSIRNISITDYITGETIVTINHKRLLSAETGYEKNPYDVYIECFSRRKSLSVTDVVSLNLNTDMPKSNKEKDTGDILNNVLESHLQQIAIEDATKLLMNAGVKEFNFKR